MFGCIVVVGVLTYCALLHSVDDLKAALINVQHSLIWGLMLYMFKVDYITQKQQKIFDLQKVKR